MQGRVFAFQEMIAHAASPLAILAAGPLAERLFEPLMAEHGPLAGSLGALMGTGAGRGVALMFVTLGLLQSAAALAGFAYRPLRKLEQELPDVNQP
jgi:DHA3 family macrolide efflux protein-like MFS transporter